MTQSVLWARVVADDERTAELHRGVKRGLVRLCQHLRDEAEHAED
jgi:hypothetical protein